MNDLLFLCLIGMLFFGALILFMVISRFLGSQTRGGYYPPAGTYDDPTIRSGGSIGGGGVRREYDDPDIRSGGSFGGSAGRPPGAASPPRSSRREHDDPDIRSGGSFGG